MSKIEEEGFLATEASKGIENYRAHYDDVFALAHDANKLALNLIGQYRFDEKGTPDSKQIISMLAIRIIETFEGVVIMLERGMVTQAKLLIRPMIEASFCMVAIQKNNSLTEYYLNKGKLARLDSLKAAMKWKDEGLRKFAKEQQLEKVYKELKKHVKEEKKGGKLKTLSVKEWAKKADLEDHYNLTFDMYCNSIHGNSSSLHDHMDIDGDGQRNIAFGPNDDGLYDTFQNAVDFLFIAVQFAGYEHSLKINTDIDKLKSRLQELNNKYPMKNQMLKNN